MRCLISTLLLLAVSLVNVFGFFGTGNVQPESYRLEITTHFGEEGMKLNFDGRVKIVISCVEETADIYLHSKDLVISENEVSVKNVGKPCDAIKVFRVNGSWTFYEQEYDYLSISFNESLKKGQRYEIDIPYKGILNEGLEGFHRSMYKDSKSNKTKWLSVTQFEETNARRTLPCFDQPDYKATFQLFIAKKDEFEYKDMSSISNMPLINNQPIWNRPGWSWDQFAISPPMSTYQFAWAVSDFKAKESKHELNNVTFKLWCREDALDQATFASEVGPKVLRFFEDYFRVAYPLPKLDMMAIPDFSARGIENLGLITLRESFLLYDPKVSTKRDQRQVAQALAHGLAHQWFGNLVNMKLWTDVWLNEGFATYMSAIAVHHLFPEWNYLEEDHANSMLDVFSFDSLESSLPVHIVFSLEDNDQAARKIILNKGSCLIRMLSLILGEETFRIGVTNYLNQHKYENVHLDVLWESLTEAAHSKNILPKSLPVYRIMDIWILQIGFPVISVKRNYENGSAEITQKHFFKYTQKRNYENFWWVPLTYSTKSEPHWCISTPKYWLNNYDTINITIKNITNKDDWLVFNNKMSGLYKVNYDEANWHMLVDVLKNNHTQIPTLNRVLLLSDAADLAYIGDLPYDVFFDLFEYLEHETEYLPLTTAFTKIEELERHVKFHPGHILFADYMKTLLAPMYKKVGGVVVRPEDENKADKIKMQTRIVSLSCEYGVQECLDDVQKLFKCLENPFHPDCLNQTGRIVHLRPIFKDLIHTVYCNAIRRGGEKEWDFVWKKFETSNVESEKNMFLSVLGCTKEARLLNRYLEWSLDKSKIGNQDCSTVFSSVASGSDLGYFIAKRFFYQNVEKLAQYLKDKSSLSIYISTLTNLMHNLIDMEEFKNFIKGNMHLFSNIPRSVDQALETIKIHTQWQGKHSQKIQEFFLLKYI